MFNVGPLTVGGNPPAPSHYRERQAAHGLAVTLGKPAAAREICGLHVPAPPGRRRLRVLLLKAVANSFRGWDQTRTVRSRHKKAPGNAGAFQLSKIQREEISREIYPN